MRKPVRLFVYLLIALAVLVALAGAAMHLLLSGDSVRAALEAQATAALGRPVRIGTARPRIFPRPGVDLGDVAIGEAREVTIGRVVVSTGLAALIHRRVEEASVTIEQSTIDVRWALALISAMAGSPAAASHPSGAAPPIVIDSIGHIALRDITLVAGGRRLLADMDASLSGGDRFVVRRLTGRSDVSNFTASGEIASIAARRGAFTVDAESIDLDGLMAYLVAATPAGAGGAGAAPSAPQPAQGTPTEIDVTVRARKGRALGLTLAGLTTVAKVRGSDVRLDDLRMDVLGGRYSGSAAFIGSDARGRYEWRGSFQGIDVPQLVAFAGAPGSMTGTLSGTVALTAAGLEAQQALRKARGSAALSVANGRVPGLEIVRSVILAFGKPTGQHPGGSGEAFTRLAATLAIAGLDASTTDLTFESRDFDMRGAGRLGLGTGAVDFRTDVVLSRELSAQAGRDLYRLAREGDRVVLPARITGTVSAPSVFIDIQAALGRALRNKAEDELKKLFDRLIRK